MILIWENNLISCFSDYTSFWAGVIFLPLNILLPPSSLAGVICQVGQVLPLHSSPASRSLLHCSDSYIAPANRGAEYVAALLPDTFFSCQTLLIFTQFTRFLHDFTRFYVIFTQFYMIFTRFYAFFAIFTRFFARHKFSAARHLKLFCTPGWQECKGRWCLVW